MMFYGFLSIYSSLTNYQYIDFYGSMTWLIKMKCKDILQLVSAIEFVKTE